MLILTHSIVPDLRLLNSDKWVGASLWLSACTQGKGSVSSGPDVGSRGVHCLPQPRNESHRAKKPEVPRKSYRRERPGVSTNMGSGPPVLVIISCSCIHIAEEILGKLGDASMDLDISGGRYSLCIRNHGLLYTHAARSTHRGNH
jgi:hypothetical protein